MFRYTKYTPLLLFFLLFQPSTVSGQQSSGGIPQSTDDLSSIPALDFTDLFAARKGEYTTRSEDKNMPYLFAIPVTTKIDPEADGKWEISGNGTRIWRLIIRCKNATSLSFIFSRFQLEKGEKLYVYDPQRTTILGAFTDRNNKRSGTLAMVPLPGNTAVIQWEIPPHRAETGKLELSKVGLGFRDIYRTGQTKDQFYGSSGACNVDINCPAGEAWQQEKNSVVRIFVNGNELCSGVLMNTVNNDATPYILTAGHCITNVTDAANAVFVFGYESPYCHGPDGSVSKSISAATFKARGGSNLDFTLVQMSEAPPFTYYPYYAGWNTSNAVPTSTVAIHHPNGDVKKISVDENEPGVANYDVYDDNTFWWIKQWDIGTTEPGSSGAPLFDQNHRVVGTLSGGDAHCGSSINDYFQMLGYSWDAYPGINEQLKIWLDPDQVGFPFWDGYDPYAAARKTCDTLTNINDGEILRLYDWGSPDAGYRTGHNEARVNAYAEVFYNSPDLFSMTGLYIMPGMIQYDSPYDKVTIKIWEYGAQPGNVIYQQDVPLSFFQDSVWNFVDFGQVITIDGNFYAGYEIYYDTPSGALTDQFAVMQVEARNNYGENYAYYEQDNLWTSFSGTPPDYMYTSLAIEPVLCGEIPDAVQPVSRKPSVDLVSVAPNPVFDRHLQLTFPEPITGNASITLSDLTGRVVVLQDQSFFGIQGNILLPQLPDGLYILRISYADKDYRAKIIIRDR